MNMNAEITTWARRLGELLQQRNWMATTAESCTGGGVAYAITEIAGSSLWFDRSVVTYTNQAKEALLGVSSQLLQSHGAVSQAVVEAMACGALQRADAQLSVAISGIAGPGGGSEEKPVGLVWFAWATAGEVPTLKSQSFLFSGDRHSVREQAILAALQGMCKLIQ